ncbi:NAD(P)H-hydrate epimerase [Miniphocaeibacter massiliensis]|uniref:NAD(P)H-hydrate epimerase n=1 Tax=Miniphocaeibacter massiliensis TaxID=2041841 RepID=UPI000C084C0C|nr:NAD(P)H-hydrate epimerase [Miniphocaeibacter massiliensis]
MISVTAEQMREIDRYTIEEIGIPSIVLMENAKNAMINFIPLDGYEKYIVVVGVGNNGGDGLAIARDLILEDKETIVFIVGNVEKGSKDFLINYNILKNIEANIINIKEKSDLIILENTLTIDDIVIDGIFGTGLNSDIRGISKEVIEILNNSKAFKFSIDIPSGLDANTGKVLGVAVKSDYVVTLGIMKKGLENYSGHVTVEDIGIPKIVIEKVLGKQK